MESIPKVNGQYSYSSGEGNRVRFVKSNGTTSEDKLLYVQMPNGHRITFNWGNGSTTSIDRVVSVNDNNAVRTVSYAYTNVLTDNGTHGYSNGTKYSGRLATVTTPAGFTTSYAYMEDNHVTGSDQATDLLTSITDPRGLKTDIYYVMDDTTALPYGIGTVNDLWAPCVWKILQANGIVLYVNNQYANLSLLSGKTFHNSTPIVQERIYSTDEVLMAANLTGGFDGSSTVSTLMEDLMQRQYQAANNLNQYAWYKKYNVQTQMLYESAATTYDTTEDYDPNYYSNLARARFGSTLGDVGSKRVITSTTNNFMGNPLVVSTSERVGVYGGFTNEYGGHTYPDKVTEYAYWGGTKYYQQKAIRTKTGSGTSDWRYSYTDYYDKDASAGRKGQVKVVYDPKNGAIYVNPDLPYPGGTPDGSKWRYQVDLGSNAKAAATFYDPGNTSTVGYDAKGRPTDVWKLQRIVSGSPEYVRTHTTYGSNTDGSWGQAATVTEDYGTGKINRLTQTLHYNSRGMADQVQDAANHVFETVYDLDGKVQSVTRTDTDPDQTVVTYEYGDTGVENGMVVSASDGLSGVSQEIDYEDSAGGAIGQVVEVRNKYNGNTTSTVDYDYNDAGDRKHATYVTTSNNTRVRWWYRDYVHVGMPDSYRRTFQTLTMQTTTDGTNWATSAEEFHYAYDSAGRLRIAAFAQHPSGGLLGSGETETYYGTGSTTLPTSRARAMYDYDPAGRLKSIKHYWDYPNSQGVPLALTDAVIGETCNYGDYLGLKTDQTFLIQDSSNHANFVTDGTNHDHIELFGYDSALDYLTSASYNNGSTTTTWSYDAAGNRNDATVVDNLNRATTISGVTRTYDIMGNTTAIGSSKTLGWDCLNRLLSFGNGTVTKTYKYRADGMRVKKGDISSPSIYTEYAYDGQMPIEEFIYRQSYGVNPLKVIRYSPGARGLDRIERVLFTGSSIIGYPLYDAHGNNVATLKKGTSADTYTIPSSDQRLYDAWGNIRVGNTTGEPNARHCANLGHLQDDESGLVYMRGRYLDPAIGRFCSEDPGMQGTNWFVYSRNDPINYLDSSGLEADPYLEVGVWLIEQLKNRGIEVPKSLQAAIVLAKSWMLIKSLREVAEGLTSASAVLQGIANGSPWLAAVEVPAVGTIFTIFMGIASLAKVVAGGLKLASLILTVQTAWEVHIIMMEED